MSDENQMMPGTLSALRGHPDAIEQLFERLTKLEQQVAQMRDLLERKPAYEWVPNPAYENAEYEYDPASGTFWKRKP